MSPPVFSSLYPRVESRELGGQPLPKLKSEESQVFRLSTPVFFIDCIALPLNPTYYCRARVANMPAARTCPDAYVFHLLAT